MAHPEISVSHRQPFPLLSSEDRRPTEPFSFAFHDLTLEYDPREIEDIILRRGLSHTQALRSYLARQLRQQGGQGSREQIRAAAAACLRKQGEELPPLTNPFFTSILYLTRDLEQFADSEKKEVTDPLHPLSQMSDPLLLAAHGFTAYSPEDLERFRRIFGAAFSFGPLFKRGKTSPTLTPDDLVKQLEAWVENEKKRFHPHLIGQTLRALINSVSLISAEVYSATIAFGDRYDITPLINISELVNGEDEDSPGLVLALREKVLEKRELAQISDPQDEDYRIFNQAADDLESIADQLEIPAQIARLVAEAAREKRTKIRQSKKDVRPFFQTSRELLNISSSTAIKILKLAALERVSGIPSQALARSNSKETELTIPLTAYLTAVAFERFASTSQDFQTLIQSFNEETELKAITPHLVFYLAERGDLSWEFAQAYLPHQISSQSEAGYFLTGQAGFAEAVRNILQQEKPLSEIDARIMTGTLGPTTKGHTQAIETIIFLQFPSNGSVASQTINIIAPLPRHPRKPIEKIRPLPERVAILQQATKGKRTPDSPHLPPEPVKNAVILNDYPPNLQRNTAERLNLTEKRLQEIANRVAAEEQTLPPTINLWRIIGADEVDQNGQYPSQEGRSLAARPHIMISRLDQIAAILAGQMNPFDGLPNLRAIAFNPVQHHASRNVRRKINEGDETWREDVPVAAQELVAEFYSRN